MAKYLMAIKQVMRCCVLPMVVGGVHHAAIAQTLNDPTRPPTIAAETVGSAASDGAAILQSILISSQRREAIINGKTVRVGDKVGNARVASITETDVVLRDGKNSQVLKLFPNIEKKRADSTRRQIIGNAQ